MKRILAIGFCAFLAVQLSGQGRMQDLFSGVTVNLQSGNYRFEGTITASDTASYVLFLGKARQKMRMKAYERLLDKAEFGDEPRALVYPVIETSVVNNYGIFFTRIITLSARVVQFEKTGSAPVSAHERIRPAMDPSAKNRNTPDEEIRQTENPFEVGQEVKFREGRYSFFGIVRETKGAACLVEFTNKEGQPEKKYVHINEIRKREE